VSCELELLEILPREQTAELLAAELSELGFARDGNEARRSSGTVTVTVDLLRGSVTVGAEGSETLLLQGTKEGFAYEEARNKRRAEIELTERLQQELEEKAVERSAALQKRVTDTLESHLNDVRAELESVVNRVTAQALKQRAAQLGQIKTITEDPASGSLTIVVEV
jgi:hypothetical protein